MKSPEDIKIQIAKIQEFNTRQKVAHENNKPLLLHLESLIEKIQVDLVENVGDDEKLFNKCNEVLKLIEDFIKRSLYFDTLKEQREKKEDILSKISEVVDKMYNSMEEKLNEVQQ